MITLKTSSISDFAKRVQFIQRNELLPILANLLLSHSEASGWQLTKNNLNAVCTGPVEGDGESATVLLDERIFFSFVAATKAEALTVEVADSKVLISDGHTKIDLPVEDVANYPVSPTYPPDATIIQLTEQHLRAIGIASHFTSPGETAGNFQFVHTGVAGVFGFHNNFFYINTHFIDLPELILRGDECEVLAGMEQVGYLDSGNHHIFFNSGYTYIFTKSEGKQLNITGVVDRLKLPGKPVVLGRDALVDFCTIANLVSETPLATCLIEPQVAGVVRVSLRDANYNRGVDRVLPCEGEPEPFAFNSRLLAPVLRVIPYEQLEAKTNQNCFIVGGREGAGKGLGTEVNEWFCFIGLQR